MTTPPAIPTHMRAVGLTRYLPTSDPACFVDVELPTPTPRGHDLLVRVEAVSVNPVDVKQRSPRPTVESMPRVLGWDAAGVVVAVGEAVTLFQPGDAVWYAGSIDRPGCNSAFHLVDERIVGRKPATLSFADAAALPLTTLTAWEALFDRMAISHDPARNHARTLLIIGGAGGVGSIAIQIAKRVAGLRVITTASRDASAAWCRELGADAVINHRQPLAAELAALGYPSVDYILCTNSVEQYIEAMAEVIAPQGKICTIIGAANNQPLPMNLFFRKSVTFAFELMYTRPIFQTADLQTQHDILTAAAGLVEAGVLRTTLTEDAGPLTAETLRHAHARLETGQMIGKLVLGRIP